MRDHHPHCDFYLKNSGFCNCGFGFPDQKHNLTVLVPNHDIFVLEDMETRQNWFAKTIPYPMATYFSTAEEALAYALSGPRAPDFAFYFLDHDLGPRKTGEHVARAMNKWGLDGTNTVIHSWNEGGAKAMKALLPKAVWMKFGTFKIEVSK